MLKALFSLLANVVGANLISYFNHGFDQTNVLSPKAVRANKVCIIVSAAYRLFCFSWNERKFSNEKRPQFPHDIFGTPTYPLFLVLEHQHGHGDVM